MGELREKPVDIAQGTILRWPTPKSRVWTLKFLEAAQKDANILAIIAVGSAVRARVSSTDLDLVVICEHLERLKDKPPIEVDLRAYEADQLDSLISGGNDLLGWAVNYGKPLFQRNNFWDRLVVSWKLRLPVPPSSVALQRADEAYRRFRHMFESGDQDAAREQAVSHLTHLARAKLLRKGLHPASRPELPDELRAIGEASLADCLERLIKQKVVSSSQLARMLERVRSVGTTPGTETSHTFPERRTAARKR